MNDAVGQAEDCNETDSLELREAIAIYRQAEVDRDSSAKRIYDFVATTLNRAGLDTQVIYQGRLNAEALLIKIDLAKFCLGPSQDHPGY